ncbi:PKD domain-containing protein [Candidatus Bathyarchaeota archaeon]|nr:PKD domain-containing protein [Candidatus Bathyarchaeota archaeon]
MSVITSAVRFSPLSYAYPGTNFYVDPPLVEMYTNETSVGDTFNVTLKFGNMTNLYGLEYKLYWNNSVINFVGVKDTLPWPFTFVAMNETTNNYNATHGRFWFSVTAVPPSTPFNGSFTVREITFEIVNAPPPGSGNFLYTLIDIQDDIFGDPSGQAIPHDTYDGEFYYANPTLEPPVASFTYSPSLIKVNVTVTFNASASTDPDGTIVSYDWDFGDGNMTSMPTPIITHIYNMTGNYTVTLNVTDNDGLSDILTEDITVWPTQIPPFANFVYSPPNIQVNSTATFDASGSYDLDGSITQYMWDFGDTNITTVTTPIITHIYNTTGNYTVTLNVTDNEGLSSIFSRNVTVSIFIPPVANFTYSPSMPSVDYPTTFDASASYDPDGSITQYMWDFGDTNITTVTTPIITHIYNTTGNYTVTLTVIDDAGLNDTMTTQITVWPAIAWLEIQPPKRLVLSEEFEVNVAIKHLGEDWHFFGLQFDLTYDTTLLQVVSATSGPFLESFPWTTSPPYTYVFIYPKPTYVTVVAGLLDGGPEPPGYTYPNGEGIVVRIKFKTTSNVEMHTSYPISFAISNVLFGSVDAQAVPNYPAIGASYFIRIDPPTPEFNYKPLDPVTGEIMTFNASASHATSPFENITIVSYEWDFGDGTTGTGVIITHAYEESGTYFVTLTVTDNNGNIRSITKTVTVTRWYITVNIDAGTTYFRGEIAEFYIQTAIWGKPIDVDIITATIYFGTQQQAPSSIEQVDTGLYRITYSIPLTASEGFWLLSVQAELGELSGTNIKGFLISSTLTGWNAQLTSISNDIATIQTDVGIIKLNMTTISATVIDIQNGIATILTDLGTIKTSLSAINATIVGVQYGIVTLSTDVGTIKTSLSAINATIIDIKDGIATLSTDLGDIQVSVDQLSTDTAEVKDRLPVDTGTIITILYVATILAAISAILLFYGLIKSRKSP